MSDFRFGCAAADITPPVGIHMGGYWGRRSGAIDIHDRLMAKVLVCGCGEEKIAIIAVDLVGLDADTVREIRTGATRRSGIPGAAVMICASHTHAGPLTMPFRGMGEIDTNYLQEVKNELVELVGTAVAKMRTGQLRYARPEVQIGLNRRQQRRTSAEEEQQGGVVPYAHVLRFEADDGAGVTLFSHACHPVVLGGDNHRISGDFAGAAARFVEGATGDMALFVNGACGDINPRITSGSVADVDALGRELGLAVLAGIANAKTMAVASLNYGQERVGLPLIAPPTRLRAEVEKLVLHFKAELASRGDPWARRVPFARLEWAKAMLKRAKSDRGRGQEQAFEIQVLRLGEIALLGLEGEIFARYQLDLEAECGAVALCGFANGCIGYVPTADEYLQGGYEVDDAYKVYPSVQMISPASEQLIRDRAVGLVARVRAH